MEEKKKDKGIKEGEKKGRSGSIGNLDEIWKRKREELDKSRGEGEDIYKRSNVGTGTQDKEMGEETKNMEEWMKEMGGKMEKMNEEIRRGFKSQERNMMELMEEMRKEHREQMREWRKEREELKSEIEKLKIRLEKTEQKMVQERREDMKGERREGKEIIEKMNRIERSLEIKEKEERRKNIIIKGVEESNGKRREAVEEIIKAVGVQAKVKEVKKIGEKAEEGRGEMILVKLESEEQKWEIMKNKRNLKGRREKIAEDLTWRERKTRRRLGEIARREGEKGKRVWIRGNRIRIDEQWWRWDEEREELREEGQTRGWREEKGEGR